MPRIKVNSSNFYDFQNNQNFEKIVHQVKDNIFLFIYLFCISFLDDPVIPGSVGQFFFCAPGSHFLRCHFVQFFIKKNVSTRIKIALKVYKKSKPYVIIYTNKKIPNFGFCQWLLPGIKFNSRVCWIRIISILLEILIMNFCHNDTFQFNLREIRAVSMYLPIPIKPPAIWRDGINRVSLFSTRTRERREYTRESAGDLRRFKEQHTPNFTARGERVFSSVPCSFAIFRTIPFSRPD